MLINQKYQFLEEPGLNILMNIKQNFVEIFINDGTTDYKVYRQQNATLVGSTNGATFVNFDFIVFLRSGDTLQASTSSNAVLNVKTYQIADITGTLVNPQGFTS